MNFLREEAPDPSLHPRGCGCSANGCPAWDSRYVTDVCTQQDHLRAGAHIKNSDKLLHIWNFSSPFLTAHDRCYSLLAAWKVHLPETDAIFMPYVIAISFKIWLVTHPFFAILLSHYRLSSRSCFYVITVGFFFSTLWDTEVFNSLLSTIFREKN